MTGRLIHLLALAAVVSSSAGNCMLRAGLRSQPNPWVLAGVAVLAVWYLLQLSLLSQADLSYVLPVTSAAYVLTALLGSLLLEEHVSTTHWTGIALIVCGVAIVARTKPLTRGPAK